MTTHIPQSDVSVLRMELEEFHDFLPDEIEGAELDLQEPLPPRPFNKIERTSDYTFHLPDKHESRNPYPWDDAAWQGEWFWRRGGISQAEAHFWFCALTHPARLTDTRAHFDAPRELRRIPTTAWQSFTAEEAVARMRAFFTLAKTHLSAIRWHAFASIARLLRELLPADELLDVLQNTFPVPDLRHTFIHLLLPEDPDTLQKLNARAHALFESLTFRTEPELYVAIRLLQRVPNEEDSLALLRAAHQLLDCSPTALRDIINTLHDPKHFASAFIETPQYHLAPDAIPLIVLRGGFPVVEDLFERVLKQDQSFIAASMSALLRIHSSRAVKGMLTLYEQSPLGPAAHAWLLEEGANAVYGLIPIAAGRSSQAHIAQRVLRELRDRGCAELITRWIQPYSPLVQDAIRQNVLEQGVGLRAVADVSQLPDALAPFIAPLQMRRVMPEFVSDPRSLSGLVLAESGERLAPEQVDLILQHLIMHDLDEPTPSTKILALRDALTEESRQELCWQILELWHLHDDARTDQNVLGIIAGLGTDETARDLARRIDEWASARKFSRASRGVATLAGIGTDAALMRIHHISQRARIESLASAARDVLDRVAEARGMSLDALEDRFVPDCGLDARGRRVFDYGARTFVMTLDADLKPCVILENGQRKKSLPAARLSDDPEAVARAKAEWKTLGAQLRDVVRVQRDRLEEAMVTQRRWTVADFERLIVRHPLMICFAQRVLWGVPDEQGALPMTFRVSESGELLDVHEEPLALSPDQEVVVAHPMLIAPTQLAAWGALFADYELSPPFAQFARVTYALLPEEQGAAGVSRFAGQEVLGLTARGRLLNRRWRLRSATGGRLAYSATRIFERAGVMVTLYFPNAGIPMRWDAEDMPCELGALYFKTVQSGAEDATSGGTALSPERVPALIFSEVIHDVREIIDRSADRLNGSI